jgi:glycosyltransferase involved in cell wall biosynthesis
MSRIPDISVVIPARNEGDKLLKAVESIIGGWSGRVHLEIVIVDDASDDTSCVVLMKRSQQWRNHSVQIRVVRLPQWSGIPYARNAGAFLARGEILFITDANVIFPTNWDELITRRFRPDSVFCATIADTRSAFVGYGCTLHLPSMGTKWLGTPYMFGGFVPVVPCSATILPADLFRRLGGYDVKMPLYGAAEPEFSVRLWLSGIQIFALPELVLFHHFRPRSRHAAFLGQFQEVFARNYIRFGLLYLDAPIAVQMLHFYAAGYPMKFRNMLAHVVNHGVWGRREELKRILRYDFADYLRHFSLRINS